MLLYCELLQERDGICRVGKVGVWERLKALRVGVTLVEE